MGFKIVRVESDHPHWCFSAVLTFIILDTIVGLALTGWKATAQSRDQPQPSSIFSLNSPRDGSFIQFLLDARHYS